MPDIKNNIKVIYNTLAKEGYNDLGSEQEFAESMADENNRKLVYNTLKGKEFADVKTTTAFPIWSISSQKQSSSKRKK